jgi:hypothetical protein
VILHQLELRIENDVVENEFSIESQLELLENYLQQFDVYREILQNVKGMSIDDKECLHDDILRVYGDANQLYTMLSNNKKFRDDSIRKHLENAREFMESGFSR